MAICGTLSAQPAYVPGRLLVGYRQDRPEFVDRVLRFHRAIVGTRLPQLGMSVLEVSEESAGAVMQSLRGTGLFDYVERDYYARTGALPNDPFLSREWHLARIQTPGAWEISTGASVVVAVVDTGVDGTHPDLASRLVPGWNFLNSSAETSDVLGHGTAVAGTVAAAANNEIGVAGVAWNSKIMPLLVVDPSDFAAYSNIAAAIQYAADHGARVINVSLGGPTPSATLQNAVDYAWNRRAVVFASAMNTSTSAPYYPAACNHAVAVSATDSTDALASYSNYGSWISLSAPGSNILTTSIGGGYGYWYGTSFASPVAAGVAALALAAQPSLTNEKLVALLEQNTDDLGAAGFDPLYGWGNVNAYRTVAATQPPPPPSLSLAPHVTTLTAGQTLQYQTTLSGLSDTTVTWSLSPSLGTISSGLYTAPQYIASGDTVNVTASSSGGVTASATITLVATPRRDGGGASSSRSGSAPANGSRR